MFEFLLPSKGWTKFDDLHARKNYIYVEYLCLPFDLCKQMGWEIFLIFLY